MSNNREFQFILKDIEKDLDNFKGKTKGEIMVLIGNE
jgi:hypothetical protein